MTSTQALVLKAIRDLTRDGVPPSYDEIAKEVGLASKSGVARAIYRLRSQGLIAQTMSGRRNVLLIASNPAYAPGALERLPSPELLALIGNADAILRRRGETPTRRSVAA